MRVLTLLAFLLACLGGGFIVGQRLFTSEPPPTPDAAATLNAQVAATATSLALTMQAPAPRSRESFGLTLYPAHVLDPTRMIVSGEVTVTAAVPEAARLEYYLQRDEAGALPELLFADVDGSNGWVWDWVVPECCWRGRVWAVAHFGDGSSANSNSIQVLTPDLIVTPQP